MKAQFSKIGFLFSEVIQYILFITVSTFHWKITVPNISYNVYSLIYHITYQNILAQCNEHEYMC